jgi:hypothetical protein
MFRLPNIFRRTMTPGSTQPVTELKGRSRSQGKNGRRLRLTISPISVRQLCRKCECLDVSEPYGSTLYVTGIALLFFAATTTYRK